MYQSSTLFLLLQKPFITLHKTCRRRLWAFVGINISLHVGNGKFDYGRHNTIYDLKRRSLLDLTYFYLLLMCD